jgi:hypothetical protein
LQAAATFKKAVGAKKMHLFEIKNQIPIKNSNLILEFSFNQQPFNSLGLSHH